MNTPMKLIILSLLMAAFILPLAAVFPGNCLSFADGNYATGTGIPTTLTAVTLEGWVNHSDLSGSYQRYLTIGNENAVIRFNGGTQLHFYIKNSAGTLKALTANVLATGEWLHVAGTYDGTTMKLYLNGVQVATTNPSPAGFTACDGTFQISRNGEAMHGKLDDFRFWTVARTQTQIQDNRFVQLTGSETGLRSYWRMDASSGTSVADDKGNSNATMYGMSNANWVASTVPVFSNTKGNAFSTGVGKYAVLQTRSGLPIYNNGTANAYSISMWIKGSGSQSGTVIYSESNLSNPSEYFKLMTASGGKIALFLLFDSGGSAIKTSTTTVFDNTWHHIAWVDNNGTATMYIDGVADATSFSYTRSAVTLNAATLGGHRGPDAENPFSGQLDEVGIWNVALSSSQVYQSMNYPSSPTASGLVAYFQANESSGKVGYDLCRGNNGIFPTDQTTNWTASTALIGLYTGGTISANTIWPTTSQVYLINNVTVNNGVTLTIDPGANIYSKGSYAINVQGRLLAVGTEANNITFTANSSSGWRGIRLDNTPSTNDSTKIVYCRLEYGKSSGTGWDYAGGAIYVYNFNKTRIKNSVFDNNRANSGYDGGAINIRSCYALIEQCTFTNNYSTGNGGAIGFNSGYATVNNCVFRSNSCATKGGAVYINNNNGDIRFYNCVLYNNSASSNGGAVSSNNLAFAVRFYNCTIWNNSAASGGGVEIASVSTLLQNRFANCIIWENTASANGSQIAVTATTAVELDVEYTDIQGGTSGIYWEPGSSNSGGYNNCWTLDPLLAYSASNPASGFVLGNSSPCINSGNNAYYAGTPTRDINGNLRFYNNTMATGNLNTALDNIDVGAIEEPSGYAILPGGVTIEASANITLDLYLHAGRNLAINSGVTLSFTADAHAYIYGNLTATGTAADRITFTEQVAGSRWQGLSFLETSGFTPSSSLEYCIIEKGNMGTGNEAWGGDIHTWYYNSLTIKNCIIRNGYSDVGGAMYLRNSTVDIINSVISDNVCASRGTGIYCNGTTLKLINCTIAGNSKTGDQSVVSYLAPLYFVSASPQPEIKNCIIYGNNTSAPITPSDGSLTNISYSDIEGGHAGTGNINKNPFYTGEAGHPYNLNVWSYCMNAGTPSIAGLNLPSNDLKNNPRTYVHPNTGNNRVDMGAYEVQSYLAPVYFVASDGSNDYPGYVYMTWEYNASYNIPPSGYRIYRNGVQYDTVDSQTFNYSDTNPVPGTIYTYKVQSYTSNENAFSAEDQGYIKPNGIISGKIETTNNNPVVGVKVTLSPSTGSCLQLSSTNNSAISFADPFCNLNQDFTVEMWVKTFNSNVTLLQTNTHILSINASGLVHYTDGSHTLVQQDNSVDINDNAWHHIALVSNYTDNQVDMYLDDVKAAFATGYHFVNYTQSGVNIPVGLSGRIDDIRIWTAVRDSSEVVDAMNIVVPFDSPGLKAYWAMNEGTGSNVFDGTDYSHNGVQTNCTWSNDDPDMEMGALTNNWGEYIISQISYGMSTNFSVTPAKAGHLFQPEQRVVTLSSSNIAANNVDFTDNSMIPITGYVKFQGTNCPVVGGVIYLNGEAALPRITTDDEGYYAMDVEHGTDCLVSIEYKDHDFNRTWNLGTVTYPRNNISFEDIFRTEYRLEVVGGQDSYPIGNFNVRMASVDGLYTREINNMNWSNGYINIASLVPLDYNVTVNPGTNDPFNLVVDDQFQSNKTKHFDQRDADSEADTLRFEWRAPLQIEAEWPDSLQVHTFAEYPDNEFFVLTQNEWYSVNVKACEDYSYDGHPDQKTYLSDCDININDEIGIKGETETAFADTTVYEYEFVPYLPNINSGYDCQYQNIIEFTVHDQQGRDATRSFWAVTQGVKPMESTYATTSPELPFLVLHDPPGDCSSSSFTSSNSHTVTIGSSVCTNQSLNIFSHKHLLPTLRFESGALFFNKETELKFTFDVNEEMSLESEQKNSWEQSWKFTTSETISTSASDDIIGDFGADVFMGGAINLIWGVSKELYWDYTNDEVDLKQDITVNPDGFATTYIYTESQIRNTVIPNLETIGDTTSANMWRSYLDKNDYNKDHAGSNPNHPSNISFCAGPSYTYSEESESSDTDTFEFDVTVGYEFGMEIGATVDGVGGEGGFTFKAAVQIGASESETTESTTTTTYTLEDDDVASDLTFNSDYFSVDVGVDPVYGTPTFELISGASSNHWEPNTQPRDGVMMTANTYTAVDVPQGQPAYFTLYLSNTGQTSEPRRYFLTVQHATNTAGATVKINGVILENQMAFDLDSLATVTAILSVEPGPFAYELENLTLEFYALDDRGYEGPDGHYFDVYKSFDIFWEAPYSRVAINYPQDGWLINQALNDTLNITFRDYDLNKPDFKSIKLEYKHPEDTDWLPAFEVMRSVLEESPIVITVPWDVSSLSDGIYEIRAATTDSIQANWYTDALIGVIDRSSPEVWGLPQPADGILQLGDVISLTFDENIDPLSILPGRVTMVDVGGHLNVDCNVQSYDNGISIVPRIANYWMENKTMRVTVHDLTDTYGNPMEEEVEWEFFVNSNPVLWHNSKIEIVKPLAQTTTFSAVLANTGGQISSFTLQDLSGWLTATPMSGTLLPLDTETITFTISSQLGFGVFTDTLYADIPGLGREPLVVKVSVLANPPAWSASGTNNYEYSMTITGKLEIDGENSSDPNDIIGAFIQNPQGIYECRGVATPEYVDYEGGSYQFFLTVQSDTEEGEPIIFKVWDASQCKEHYGITEEFSFYSGFVHGTPLSPITVHVSPQLINNISCKTGWTWLSTNLLDSQSMTVDHLLSSVSATNNDIIKSQTHYAQYATGSGWVGSLGSLSTTQAYKLKVAANSNLQIIGLLENPNTTPISYGSGWNWISYLPHVSISVNEALADIGSPVSGDMIKNQRAYAQYISGYGWVGSLRFMNPGEGYLLKTANAGSFNYPDYQVSRSWQRYRDPDPIVQVPGWDLDPLDYEYSANLTGVIQQNGLAVGLNYVLGAFVGNECRGIAQAIEVMGTNMYFLTLYANTLNETLSFKVYDTTTQAIVNLPVSLPFVNNQVTGNPFQPYVFQFPMATLESPKNLRISLEGNHPKLNWDAVAGAQTYNVYRASDPNAPLQNWSLAASGILTTNWIDLSQSGACFYLVTAVAGTIRAGEETPEKPQEITIPQIFNTKPEGLAPSLQRKP